MSSGDDPQRHRERSARQLAASSREIARRRRLTVVVMAVLALTGLSAVVSAWLGGGVG